MIVWKSSKAKRLGNGKEMPGYLSAIFALSRDKWLGSSELSIYKGRITNINDDYIKSVLQDIFLPIVYDKHPQLKRPFSGKIMAICRSGDRYDEVQIIER